MVDDPEVVVRVRRLALRQRVISAARRPCTGSSILLALTLFSMGGAVRGLLRMTLSRRKKSNI